MPPASAPSGSPAPQTIPHVSLLSITPQTSPVFALSPVSTSHYFPNTANVFSTFLPPECPQPHSVTPARDNQSVLYLVVDRCPLPGQLAHVSSSAATQKQYWLISHPLLTVAITFATCTLKIFIKLASL